MVNTKRIISMCMLLLLAVAAHSQQGFSISNGKVIDGKGNEFIMRGVNHPHAWYEEKIETAVADISAAGANCVRVVLANGEQWSKTDATSVRRIIDLCKEYNLVAVLEVHDCTGYGDADGHAPNAADISTATQYWVDLADVLQGEEDYVIINIANEPFGNGVEDSWWMDKHLTAIQAIREAGLTHLLMIDAPNWGQDWASIMRTNAPNLMQQSPDSNIVFSVHMYEVFDTDSEVDSYMQTFVDNNLPLVVGEFGADHKGAPVAADRILEKANELGIGYIGWSWCGNSDETAALDIIQNWDASSLSEWGELLLNSEYGIKNTAQTATVFDTEGTLTINIEGNGSVTVDDQNYSAPVVLSGPVTLEATAGEGQYFLEWTGDVESRDNPVGIRMNGDRTVTARFATPTQEMHTVTIDIEGDGLVEVNGQAYAGPMEIQDGSTVTLDAVPENQDWSFEHWSGGFSGNENPISFTLTQDTVVNALFVQGIVAGDDLIENGDFSQGEENWQFAAYEGAEATASYDSEEFKAQIQTIGSAEWHVQLQQTGILLEKGDSYVLSFDAWAEGEREIVANVSMIDSPWTSYLTSGGYNAELTTSKQSYEVEFTMTGETNENSRIEFNLGTSDIAVFIDNVKLIKQGSSSGTANRFSQRTVARNLSMHYLAGKQTAVLAFNTTRPFGKAQIRIFDLRGKVIASKRLSDISAGLNKIRLNCADIPNGTYLLNLRAGKQNYQTKLNIAK